MLKTVPELLAAIEPPVRKISAQEAAAECANNGGIVIDVREPAEHMSSPAPGAINIPRGVLEMKVLELFKDADKPIYLHCASSARAQLAAAQLAKLGYTNVSVMTCSVPDIQQALA